MRVSGRVSRCLCLYNSWRGCDCNSLKSALECGGDAGFVGEVLKRMSHRCSVMTVAKTCVGFAPIRVLVVLAPNYFSF